ncbi:hypothetical protein GCM10010317_077940 [Streptomyces mirabilis]|uniref:hypothetical protein n=1 Tax=Streptomyces mirabilis TaxID=68239 RepID=UPI00167CA632|nr:hypothetical protein [Streptomyces mirabilis]GHD70515.1 hypothetical protein GCM10010317_077940 [Streptomyces mirabilis]
MPDIIPSATTDTDLDPFWVKHRAGFLAAKSTSADPSACGTCRGNVKAGEPVEHDECAQRATLLQAPDHPYFEILAGFSLEENQKLPARFHVPVFDDCGVPNSWLCAVCQDEGTVTGWPCATAVKYGKQVFTPLREAETAQKKQAAELAAYRALDLGDLDGRVSATCDNPGHPTWLRTPDDTRGCPWCRTVDLENALAATGRSLSSFIFDSTDPGADALGAQWLYHQAMPHADDPFAQPRAFRSSVFSEAAAAVEQLDGATTNERSERPQSYLDGYSDGLLDASERLEKLADQAAEGSEGGQVAAPQHYDKVPDPADGCHWCACGNRWPCKGDGAVTG